MSLKRKLTIFALVVIPPAAALLLATAIGWLQFGWSWGGAVLVAGVYAGWIAILAGLAEFTGFLREEKPSSSRPGAPFQVPYRLTEFEGREGEIRQLVRTLKPGAKAAITGVVGMGGIGKTELAKVIAGKVAGRFRDGVLWADCGQQELTTVADLWASAYREQLPEGDLTTKSTAWRGLASGKEALLIFDDVRPGRDVKALFPPSGRSAVLMTSRHAGHPAVRDVEPLRLDQFSPEEAVGLAERVLGQEKARRQAAEADRLFELVGYLPLAVNVALHMAEECDWRLEYLNGKLEASGALEVLEGAENLEKSLQATFETAWETLTDELRLTFRVLMVFNAGPSFSTLALAETLNLEEPEARAHLRRLAGRSLLNRVGEERWALHALLREFVEGRGPVSDVIRARMARHYEGVARAANALYKQGHEDVMRGLAFFDLEWPHIEMGQAWAADHAAASEEAARLCSDYAVVAPSCLSLRLPPRDLLAWLEPAVRAARRLGDEKAEGRHLGNLGLVYANKGEWDRAIKTYERSLETKERVGDVHGMAQTWVNLGSVYLQKSEWDRAIEMYERSLETFERVGDVHGMAGTWVNLGSVYAGKGEWNRAIETYELCLEAFERVGDVHGMAATWTNMALAYLQTDRGEEAKPLLARAYSIFARMGSPDADTAFQELVQACGSVDAANAYLERLTADQE